jgi:hypothetical protein
MIEGGFALKVEVAGQPGADRPSAFEYEKAGRSTSQVKKQAAPRHPHAFIAAAETICCFFLTQQIIESLQTEWLSKFPQCAVSGCRFFQQSEPTAQVALIDRTANPRTRKG